MMLARLRTEHITSINKYDMEAFYERPLQEPQDGCDMCIIKSNVKMHDNAIGYDATQPKTRQKYRCIHVNIRTKTARLIRSWHAEPYRPQSEWICIKRETFIKLQQVVLRWTLVEFGDQIYRQELGMPMGSDNSNSSSRALLDDLDKEHMDKIITEARSFWPHDKSRCWDLMREAARWEYLERQVDDMHWANNPRAKEDLSKWGQRDGHSIWTYLSYKDV